jgi:hypothetical protein
MRRAYQVLSGLLAVEVVVQAMAIAYALAGLGKWVEDDGGVLDKNVLDHSENLHFRGVGGFAVHGINGQMVIPLIAVALLVVSFFVKTQGAVRRAAILFGMVAVQVVLGLTLHSEPLVAPVHALNGFGIFVMAGLTAWGSRVSQLAAATESAEASRPVVA